MPRDPERPRQTSSIVRATAAPGRRFDLVITNPPYVPKSATRRPGGPSGPGTPEGTAGRTTERPTEPEELVVVRAEHA
ncbi:hypothetical protein ACOT81_35880 [Streptomyces sp. WI04-05B]|uniref:hypothetical protein n=1 Tax=Streptomyces TaxID=1883 RepID=UPI0029BB5389|nr:MULTISPECIES: hypothetical protein [unclassified Streptomyces]MDX2548574.1 hypothetical protein [Streptomyces sp. WI04-05B]MDX2588062.1 hypothetical protein [Streptomyces sp. WI04-05A]MDX3751754.1 hypothetical protein [Streptomyces sp. AK08-02]